MYPEVLHTGRLRLRVPLASDLDIVHALHSDPRLHVHQPYAAVRDRAEAEHLLTQWRRHWSEVGFGYWVAEDAGSGAVVGLAGVRPSDGYLNLGYRFAAEVQGRGLATEAARATVDAAVEWLPLQPVRAVVKERNIPSVTVALSCGMTRAGSMTFPSDPPGEDSSTVFEAPAVELPDADPDGWDVLLRLPDGSVVGRAVGGGTAAGADEPELLVPPARVGRHLEAILLAALRRRAREGRRGPGG